MDEITPVLEHFLITKEDIAMNEAPKAAGTKDQLSEEEIAKLRKKGHLCYRPKIEAGRATVSNRTYLVGSDNVWRLPTPRVRQSKKERLKARRRCTLTAAVTQKITDIGEA